MSVTGDETTSDDPVFRHASREALIILALWAAATAAVCGRCYALGYNRPGRAPLVVEDLRPIAGIPRWFALGVLVPWACCSVATILFAVYGLADDDLGEDHAAELDADIRAEAQTHARA
jgi:hypothetical protein